MLEYMYIYESGDLGSSTKFLVIAALIVPDPAQLDRIIKNVRRHKFRKELKDSQEIHAYTASTDLKKHLIKKLNEVSNIQCYAIILEKKKVYSEYLQGDKHKLYNFVAGKLAEFIRLRGTDIEVRIDRSKGKQALQQDFNQYFSQKLSHNMPTTKIKIFHSWSHSWSGLQLADLIAWAVFQKVERADESYTDLMILPLEVASLW